MKLNELSPSVPKKNRKRIGRGNSSGWGKTAGKVAMVKIQEQVEE